MEIIVAAENNDLTVNFHLLKPFQNLYSIHNRHTNIQKHDIRLFLLNHFQTVLAIVGFSYDLIAIVLPFYRGLNSKSN